MYVIVYVKMFCSLLHVGSFYTVKFTVPIFNSFVEIFTQIKNIDTSSFVKQGSIDVLTFPSPTKLRRDIVTLPSVLP